MSPIWLSAPAPQSTVSLIDRWYRALDRRRITVGPRRWRALVDGIHVHGDNLWIQISHADNSDESLVLCVPRGTSIESVITAEPPWAPLDLERHGIHVIQ